MGHACIWLGLQIIRPLLPIDRLVLEPWNCCARFSTAASGKAWGWFCSQNFFGSSITFTSNI